MNKTGRARISAAAAARLGDAPYCTLTIDGKLVRLEPVEDQGDGKAARARCKRPTVYQRNPPVQASRLRWFAALQDRSQTLRQRRIRIQIAIALRAFTKAAQSSGLFSSAPAALFIGIYPHGIYPVRPRVVVEDVSTTAGGLFPHNNSFEVWPSRACRLHTVATHSPQNSTLVANLSALITPKNAHQCHWSLEVICNLISSLSGVPSFPEPPSPSRCATYE